MENDRDSLIPNPFSSIWKSFTRWRHSRGFGVHSPFAYNLVTTAINPQGDYSYYGYKDIEDSLSGDHNYRPPYRQIKKDAQLVLRLIVALGIKRLAVWKYCYEPFRAAAMAAGIKYEPITDMDYYTPIPGDLVVLAAKRIHPLKLLDCIAWGGNVMGIDYPDDVDGFLSWLLNDGVLFTGSRIFLLVENQDMAFVRYPMKF